MPNGAKHWCFTINNPSQAEKDGDSIKDYDYCILGQEVGDDGTPHVQGYIVMKTKRTLAQMKQMLPRAHLEIKVRRSTPQQAADYCKKDGNYIECGKIPLSDGEASKERFKRNIQLAKEGNLDELMEVDPQSYVQHYHSYKRIIQDNPKKLEDLKSVCGEWIWGEPGVGKSYTARKENLSIYDKPANKWFDGYKGEEVVLIDDFDMNHKVLGHHLKRWADRYSFPAEMKGTTIQIRPKKIVVTSNYSIEQIFHEDETLIKALKRRFKERNLISLQMPLNSADSVDLDDL